MLPARFGTFFSREEFTRVSDPVPTALEANVLRVMIWIDTVRRIIGVPIILTSGYRGAERNERVGGSNTSDHPNGLALDFKPQGISLEEFYRRFLLADNAGQIPPYDQIILYPHTTGHVHVGIGSRMRRQRLVVTREADREVYKPLTKADQLKRGGALLVVVVALAVVALIILSLRKG